MLLTIHSEPVNRLSPRKPHDFTVHSRSLRYDCDRNFAGPFPRTYIIFTVNFESCRNDWGLDRCWLPGRQSCSFVLRLSGGQEWLNRWIAVMDCGLKPRLLPYWFSDVLFLDTWLYVRKSWMCGSGWENYHLASMGRNPSCRMGLIFLAVFPVGVLSSLECLEVLEIYWGIDGWGFSLRNLNECTSKFKRHYIVMFLRSVIHAVQTRESYPDTLSKLWLGHGGSGNGNDEIQQWLWIIIPLCMCFCNLNITHYGLTEGLKSDVLYTNGLHHLTNPNMHLSIYTLVWLAHRRPALGTFLRPQVCEELCSLAWAGLCSKDSFEIVSSFLA